MLNVNNFRGKKKDESQVKLMAHFIYQRFQHITEANGSFCIALTHQPRLYAALNKGALNAGSCAI